MSDLSQIDTVAGVKIYEVSGKPKTFIYKAGMAICADGAANCYGPDNSGIDYTANGGDDQGGNWWAGPTGSNGKPLVQAIYDPYPGLYVCATAHFNPAYPQNSQYRYVDSAAIPFIVLPGQHSHGALLGDVCLCYQAQSGENCYGIYADVGPSSKIGEASMRMAQALKIDDDPKKGGTDARNVVYLVFPGSVGRWVPPNVWFDEANTLTKAWGGLSRLRTLIPLL
jgi:glycosyl hydrolase group 75 (putative chitosanase)